MENYSNEVFTINELPHNTVVHTPTYRAATISKTKNQIKALTNNRPTFLVGPADGTRKLYYLCNKQEINTFRKETEDDFFDYVDPEDADKEVIWICDPEHKTKRLMLEETYDLYSDPDYESYGDLRDVDYYDDYYPKSNSKSKMGYEVGKSTSKDPKYQKSRKNSAKNTNKNMNKNKKNGKKNGKIRTCKEDEICCLEHIGFWHKSQSIQGGHG